MCIIIANKAFLSVLSALCIVHLALLVNYVDLPVRFLYNLKVESSHNIYYAPFVFGITTRHYDGAAKLSGCKAHHLP